VIKWTEDLKYGFKGVVTLDDWGDKGLSTFPKTFICDCEVTKNSEGMSGIGSDGVIVPLSEEEISQVNELMRWYYVGRKKEKETYVWL
jgi:hypothetical protein